MDNGQFAKSLKNYNNGDVSASEHASNSDQFTPERNIRQIGNKAIDSSESALSVDQDNEKLGEIIDLELPPINKDKQPSDAEIIEQSITFDKHGIQTTDRLRASGIKEVDRITQKLSQDGNIADFYDVVRGDSGMVETNLENSYHRKIPA